MSNNDKRITFIINSFYCFIIILLAFFFIKYLLGPLSPFIAAFIVVAICRKIIIKLEFFSQSKKYAAAFFTSLLIVLLTLFLYGIFFGFFRELSRLSESLTESAVSDYLGIISQKISSLKETFPTVGVFSKLFDFALGGIEDMDEYIIKSLTGTIPSILSYSVRFLSFFPAAVIFLGFMFIAIFYISCDYDRICSFILLQLPEKMLDTIDETKNIITSTAKELFKSYFLLTLITFFQLLIGFLILGVEYSLLSASLICFVDLMPILGAGTVIIPWSLICFFTGNVSRAAGLLVLYAVITIFRRIAEPKIIGNNIGLSPLLSLISIFLGIKFLGFSGIFIFPILTITITSLNRKGFIRLYKNFPENSIDKISKTRKKFLDFKRGEKHRAGSHGGLPYDKNDK